MKIEHEFTVDRPVADVWEFFQDVPAVADCLPGAELKEDRGDSGYAGVVSVKLGPMTAAFEGDATITPDPEARSAHISGKGVDKRGGSRGQVNVDYSLSDADGAGTRVAIEADVTLSGPAAQFGRTGLINEISKRLIGEFVDCLEAKLSATSVEEASAVQADRQVNGFALFFSSLWSWLKRLFRRPE
jgi:carbon monoxide dehydrogenase subunit G